MGGGYVNPKLELRREIPDNPNSPMGVYATETIEISINNSDLVFAFSECH